MKSVPMQKSCLPISDEQMFGEPMNCEMKASEALKEVE
jgi:hypothetical protein